MPPTNRNPRVDPKPGDVVEFGPQWQRERYTVTATSAKKLNSGRFLDMVYYRIGKSEFNCALGSWRGWTKSAAEVIHAAD